MNASLSSPSPGRRRGESQTFIVAGTTQLTGQHFQKVVTVLACDREKGEKTSLYRLLRAGFIQVQNCAHGGKKVK